MSHFLARSQSCIEHLLASTSTSLINSTLTISGTNYIRIYNQELEALKSFIKSIGKHRTYIDTAFDLDGNNQQKSNSKVVKKKSKSFTMVIVLVTLFGVGILAAIGFGTTKRNIQNLCLKSKKIFLLLFQMSTIYQDLDKYPNIWFQMTTAINNGLQ